MGNINPCPVNMVCCTYRSCKLVCLIKLSLKKISSIYLPCDIVDHVELIKSNLCFLNVFSLLVTMFSLIMASWILMWFTKITR